MPWPQLFSPVRFLGMPLKNRVVVGPMTRTSATGDGLATPIMADYYAQYASGGFAMVIAEATYVDEAHSQGWWNQPGIANAAQRDWRPVAGRHKADAASFCSCITRALCQATAFVRTIAPRRCVRRKMAEHQRVRLFQVAWEITGRDSEVIKACTRRALRRRGWLRRRRSPPRTDTC
jgi:2,4-dienoyl-CoA reductase-like NADH-dependent reductase (Old Yellow Enzyme family)